MTKSFYTSAILLTAIYLTTGLFQSMVFFHLGAAMYDLPSIGRWSVFMYLISLTWSLLMLKYYHKKKYRLTFWTMSASIAASLFQFYLFYNLIVTREISISYIAATILLLITGILYALSLLFSSAGARHWLRTAGVLQLILGLTMLFSFTWALLSVSARVDGTIETLEQWISLVSSIMPVVFILNFMSERATAEKTEVLAENSSELIFVTSLIVLAGTLFFVPRFAIESLRPMGDHNNISEGLKKAAQPFEGRTFHSRNGDSLQYRLMMPLDYERSIQYPLVLCLHGSSAVGTDNVKQIAATLPARLLSNAENRKTYPAFLFVPQCPRGLAWGGIPEHPSVDSLLIEAIQALQKEYSIDSLRIYATGYSMGGYGAWHLICKYPEMFAAAVPICGGGDPACAARVVNIPVWAFHGARDLNVPVSETRNMIEAIRKAGGHPRYTEFPDASHDIWAEVTHTTDLPAWLFAQKRE